jgi:hypothetical protein
MHLRMASDYTEPPPFTCPVCRGVPDASDLARVQALTEVSGSGPSLSLSHSSLDHTHSPPRHGCAQEARADGAECEGPAGVAGGAELLLSKAMQEQLLANQKRMTHIEAQQSARGGLVGMRDPPPASEAEAESSQAIESSADGRRGRAGRGGRRRGRGSGMPRGKLQGGGGGATDAARGTAGGIDSGQQQGDSTATAAGGGAEGVFGGDGSAGGTRGKLQGGGGGRGRNQARGGGGRATGVTSRQS